MCIIIIVDYVLLAVMDFFSPRDKIDRAPKFELERWKRVRPPLMLRARSSGPRADTSLARRSAATS